MVSNSPVPGLLGRPSGELVLRVRGTQRHGQKIRIADPKCSIGSAAGCSLRLSAPGVQPLHCVILQGERGSVIRRWGPDTRINGQAFRDWQLSVGDRLSVGPLEFDILALPGAARDLAGTFADDADLKSRLMTREQQLREVRRQSQDQQQSRRQLRKLSRRRALGLIERLRGAQQQTKELQEKCRGLEASLQSLASETGQLRELASQQQRRRDAAESARLQLVAQLEELSARYTRQQSEWLEEDKSHGTEKTELQEQLDALHEELQVREGELAALREEAENSKTTLDRLNAALDHQKEQLEVAQRQWTDQRDKLEAELSEARQELAAANQALLDESQARQQESQARQDEGNRHREELEKLEKSLSQAQSAHSQELERLQAEVADLKRQLAESAQELDSARSQWQLTQEEMESARSQWQLTQQEWETERESLKQQCQELQGQQAQWQDHSAEVSAEREQYAARQQELDALAQEVERQKESLLAERNDWQQEKEQFELHLLADKEALEHERTLLDQQRPAEGQDDTAEVPAEPEQYAARQQELDALAQEVERQKEALLAERNDWQQEKEQFELQLQADKETLEHERTLLGDQRENIAQERERLDAVQHTLEERQVEFQRHYEHLEEQLRDLEQERERLEHWQPAEAGPDEREETRPFDEPEEEPCERTSGGAPVSTREVLARLGQNIDDEPEEMPHEAPAFEQPISPVAQHEPAESPSPSGPVESPTLSEGAESAGETPEDEESIDSYMAGLMQRVGASDWSRKHPSDQGQLAHEAQKGALARAAEDSAELQKYVPRALPPEMSSNLAAMRDLANQTARSAIDRSTKRRWGNAALGKFLVAAVAILSGFLLWWWSRNANWYSQFGAWTAFVIATFWLLQSSVLMRNLFVLRRQTSKFRPSSDTTVAEDSDEAEDVLYSLPEDDDVSL